MGRPKSDDPMIVLPVRVARSTVDAVEAWAAQKREQTPGLNLPRSEAARILLLAGLRAEGMELPSTDKPKTKPRRRG